MGSGNSQIQNQPLVYSVPVSQKVKGETEIRRAPQFKDKLHPFYIDEDKKTLRDLYEPIFTKNSTANFLGTKSVEDKYQYKTYGQCYELFQQLGSGIYNMNLAPEVHEYQDYKIRPIGVLSRNREEWIILDMTSLFYGLVLTCLYSTMPEIQQSIKIAGLSTIFGSKEWFDVLIKLEGSFEPLKTYVCFDKFDENDVNLAKAKGITLVPYQQVMDEGKKKMINFRTIPVQPEDLFTFVFTSGTTGRPKCTMAANKNMLAFVTSQTLPRKIPNVAMFDQELSLAPLAHFGERLLELCLIAVASTIHFSSYIPEKLLSEYQSIKPTLLVSATRFYNRIYNIIMEKVNQQGCFKRYIFQKALNAKLANLKKGQLKHAFWDKLVFNKIKHTIMGNRVRIMTAGAQPCSEKIFNTLRVIFGIPFVQIYGQTECVGVTFETSVDDFTAIDHVGGPNVLVEFKLIDRPEFGYFTDSVDEKGRPTPRGELAVRSDQNFIGYYKNPEETEKTIMKDGFLLTGDVAELLPNGSIKILDRSKNIFKLLSGAEFICPENVENIYISMPLIDNIYLYGDYLKEYCVAIIQLKKDVLMGVAKKMSITGSYEEICQNKQIYDYVMNAIQEYSEKVKIKPFEQPKKIYIESKPFSEMGLLTISLKIQRVKCRAYYKPIIDKLYQQK